eukprot:COSAG01_NODE_1635_length_9663_cov_75.743831_12_plen_89_part_00
MCAHGGQHESGGARPRLRHGGGEGLAHGPRTPGVDAIDVPAGHGAKGRHHPKARQIALPAACLRSDMAGCWLRGSCCRCLSVMIFCRF